MRITLLFASLLAGAVLLTNPLSGQSMIGHDLGIASQIRPGSYLGVHLSDIDSEGAKALKLDEARGVEVKRVEEGSPADQAGIKAGDVLLTYNGENILGAQQLGRLVAETPQGRKIKIEYWRDGKTHSTAVTTGAPTAAPFDLPPNFVGFPVPDMRNFAMPDVPNPLLVWRNSWIGVECEPIDSQLAEYFGVKRGVLVRSVAKNSPAGRAGIKAGDVLTAIDERTVATPRDLSSYMRGQHQSGKPILIALVRDHKELKVSVVPSANPE
jgi:serine protease Do